MSNKSNESSDVMSNEVSQDVLEADISISLLAAKQKGEFLAQCHKVLDDDKHDESRFKSILIKLHNTGKIDLVHEFGLLKKTDFNGSDSFFVRKLFKDILPELEASTVDVCLCARRLVDELRDDGAVGLLWDGVEKFLLQSRNRVDEAFEFSVVKELRVDLLPVSCRAALRSDFHYFVGKIICRAKDESLPVEIRRAFLDSLPSCLEYNPDETKIKILVSLVEEYVRDGTEQFDRELFRLAIELFPLRKEVLGPALEKILLRHNPEVLYLAALFFSSKRGYSLPEKKIFLDAFLFIPAEHIGTIGAVDCGLCGMLIPDQWETCIDFITKLIARTERAIKITQFPVFLHKLQQVQEEYRNHIVTKWFLSQDVHLFRSVDDLYSSFGSACPLVSVDKSLAGVDQVTIFFLSRKALGWLYDYADACVSFVLSCLDLMDKDTKASFRPFFVNPLALSYLGRLKALLPIRKEKMKASSSVYVESVIAQIEEYYKRFQELPDCPEVQVSTEHRLLYNKHQSKIISDAMKEAQEESILSKIAINIPLLHGGSFVIYSQRDGKFTRGSPDSLQRFSSTTEIPRLPYVDPLCSSHTLRVFRLERLIDEVDC